MGRMLRSSPPRSFRAVLALLWLVALVVAACAISVPSGRSPGPLASGDHPPQPEDLPAAPVRRVVDGDTIDVLIAGRAVRVRLIGIDTPEVADPRQPVECFGREASAKANELLAGQIVRLEADPSQGEQDRYGRLLRYVWLPDGRLVNLELIRQGYAFEYTYDRPYKYQAVFKEAERDARAQQRGLWAPATCNGRRRAG